MPTTPEAVLDALRQVQDPDLHRDIVTLGFVKDIEIDGPKVSFKVQLTTPACPVKDILQQQAHDVVAALPGVEEVEVEMTAQVRQRPEQGELIPNVKQCIAIASGKGGVGKSTVSVNIAVALAQTGAKVGLLDADVYGPSIPLMLGIDGAHPLVNAEKKIVPVEKHGIKIMSLGLLMDKDQVAMWRGPMVAGTVRQLLADVDWGDLDYLIVDLPPGTGDAPMSLAQLVPLSGVVIVSTPQAVAAQIAGKCAGLFRRLNTHILGVVENMAEYVCPGCGSEVRLFAGTTGEALAADLHTAYLGSVPLDPHVSQSCETGMPSLTAYPDRPQAKRFHEISSNLAAQISIHGADLAVMK